MMCKAFALTAGAFVFSSTFGVAQATETNVSAATHFTAANQGDTVTLEDVTVIIFNFS